MKKQYIAPAIELTVLSHLAMICNSITGVANTSNFSEDISDETTDEVLSRRHSAWDDNEAEADY